MSEIELSRELQAVGCGIVISPARRRQTRPYAVVVEKKRRRVAMRPAILSVIVDVAHAHDVTLDQIMGMSRRRPVVKARHAAMRAVSEHVELGRSHFWTATAIGHLFGMDHTAVLYALGRLKRKQPAK